MPFNNQKSNQANLPFVSKKSNSGVAFLNSPDVSNNKSAFSNVSDVNVGSRLAQARSEYTRIHGKDSKKNRDIQKKIKDIKRVIEATKSQYSTSGWNKVIRNRISTKIPTIKLKKPKPVESLESLDADISSSFTSTFANFNLAWEPLKPILQVPVNDTPHRRKFLHQYDVAYKKVVQSLLG